MTFVIRAARDGDLDALYEMAELTGGGFTNLPADRDALTTKLGRSRDAFSKPVDAELGDDQFVLILEDTATGEIRGTNQLFTKVGSKWPFYSYRLQKLAQYSQELDRMHEVEVLTLTNDMGGASEVGGLFLHPEARSGGLGTLLARSRYMFIAAHRARFDERLFAELRGVIDEHGQSPFWDSLGAKFFGMEFRQADDFNAVNGNQFIADLMPKYPIYVALLSKEARAVIGQPHTSGRAAVKMLEKEGFSYRGYVDIFDGGPTMSAETDKLASVQQAKTEFEVAETDCEDGEGALLATGELNDFRCCYGTCKVHDGTITIDKAAAGVLGVSVGDRVRRVSR